VEFCVLGPPQIITEAGAVPMAGHRQLTVLALLLLNRGRIVPLEQLVDAVWEDDPPATAKRQIQNCVSALRGLLDRHGRREPIVADGPGYRIRLEGGELDLQRFESGVAAATELALDDDRASEAVAEFRSALRLWQGSALAGLTSRVVRAAAIRLEEQRLAATDQCCELELRLGRHDRLIGELTELVAAHPYRERLVGQLMLALHRSGRQAEALETYQRFRTLLADELGLDPGSALRDLHAEILGNSGEVARRRPDRPRPAQLPADVAGFTGRADRLKELDELLPDKDGPGTALTIAAIVGTAGVGKTALAVHWAHRVRDHFPDGQLYVDLRGYASDAPVRPVEALAQLLLALGVSPEQIPVDVEPAAGLYRSLLADRRVLVVLDNLTGGEQARPLLPGRPGCLVIVTSRNRLTGLVARDGALRLSLDVLTVEESQALLSKLLGPERVAGEPEATVELARTCACLPLALRVAAANLMGQPEPSIAAYVAELRPRSRLAFLEADGDTGSAVRGAFDLSYQAIGSDEQRLFRLFGLVPGPDVSRPAAAAMAGVGVDQAARLLDRLAASHLVGQPAPGRYTCHDLLRQFAADQARSDLSPAERLAVLGRLCDWYLHQARAAGTVLYPHRLRLPVPEPAEPTRALLQALDTDTEALAWLDSELANLTAAIRHAAEHGLRRSAYLLADTLRGYFWLRMHTVAWAEAASVALTAASAEGDLRAQCAALLSMGDLHFRRNEYDQAIGHQRRALDAATRSGWLHGQAAAYGSLGIAYRESGRLQEAASHFERSLALNRESGFRYGEAVTLGYLGAMYLHQGELPAAAEHTSQALARYQEVGSRPGEAAALEDLGEIRIAQGRLDEATILLTYALNLRRQIGDRGFEASTMSNLAAAHGEAGQIDRAVELAHASATLAGDVGDRRVEAGALNVLARISARVGHQREAVRHHRRALELSREIGNRYLEAEALLGLSTAQRELGQLDEALGHARQALSVARDRGFRRLAEHAVTLIG
jgi:DNA-binding SARP family transcriptional activator